MEREPLISLIEKIVKRLASEIVTPKYVKRAVYGAIAHKLPADKMERVVRESSEEFERAVIAKLPADKMERVVRESSEEFERAVIAKVEAKVDRLIEIIRDSDPNAQGGWRPSGIPRKDISGHARLALLEHVKRLEEIKKNRLDELEEKKAYVNRLKEQIKELDDGSFSILTANTVQN
ncbi:hypothetical protein Tcan_07500 [Toxocara canis]|uniref:Uncharacterized protein n=1 Tax=Toxocara canis TaxID=6265 RepID=A0A0B2VMI8_TOXCA|nr:hypothetical protein Tcan_07500 [Toxocara canis]